MMADLRGSHAGTNSHIAIGEEVGTRRRWSVRHDPGEGGEAGRRMRGRGEARQAEGALLFVAKLLLKNGNLVIAG